MKEDDRDSAKAARRTVACIEACRGISTEALERIAALSPAGCPAALAEAARRQSLKGRSYSINVVTHQGSKINLSLPIPE